MTVTHAESHHAESPYLEGEYLAVDVVGSVGMQATVVIRGEAPLGAQALVGIQDRAGAVGCQADLAVLSAGAFGHQGDLTVLSAGAVGGQADLVVLSAGAVGCQADLTVGTGLAPHAMQYTQTNFNHLQCQGHLDQDYLAFAHLAASICAHGAMQATLDVTGGSTFGQGAEFHVVDHRTPFGQGAEFHVVDHRTPFGQGARLVLSKRPATGHQGQLRIDARRTLGQQGVVTVLASRPLGMQVEILNVRALGMQATVSLYNTKNLRILSDFPSRGLSSATGTNAWGAAAGTGQTWKANGTAAGDFSVQNLNTDIVEQAWRSTTDNGIHLDCDTERSQGVFLDTLAVLEHNLTSSATVTLIGSQSPTFLTPGVAIPLDVRDGDPNIYYVAPALPTRGYRYWRLSIDDPSNPAGYVQIGAVVFGAARIFVGECFVDEVEFQLKDYTDSVQTEGFTNVNNSRAQKKILRLDFRSLSYLKANFRLMRSMFRHERTVLKCLWIPTPSPTNQEYSARFALFAKLAQIPSERHNHKGGDADYVSFSIELDESK